MVARNDEISGHPDSNQKACQVSIVGQPLYLTQPHISDDKDINAPIHSPLFHKEQYVLLPTRRRVVVLSSQTGKCLHFLKPKSSEIGVGNSDNDLEIECVGLATLPANEGDVGNRIAAKEGESVLLAFLSNGTLAEFDLTAMETSDSVNQAPRRVFSFRTTETKSSEPPCLIHLSCPVPICKISHNTDGGVSVYALQLEQPQKKTQRTNQINRTCKLVSFIIPKFRNIFHCTLDKGITLWHSVSMKDGTIPFFVNSFYVKQQSKSLTNLASSDSLLDTKALFRGHKDDSDWMVYHVMTTPTTVGVCLHKPLSFNSPRNPKDSYFVSYTPMAIRGSKKRAVLARRYISSIAVNRHTAAVGGGAELSIGYSTGRIDLLYNFCATLPHLFLDPAMYVTKVKSGQWLKCSDEDLCVVGLGLEDQSAVIKTVHWHHHPVLTLVFHTPTLLLSGGEEAVMVSWSLIDQHESLKPCHTLPRMTRGDIVSLSSAYSSSSSLSSSALSSRVMVMGRNNSICFLSAPEYAQKWTIQGLAAMNGENMRSSCRVKEADYKKAINFLSAGKLPSLQSDDGCVGDIIDSQQVIMMLDPRTRTPLCANLAGDPGAVHWYSVGGSAATSKELNDERLLLMAGQLQVVAYNRTSRQYDDSPPDLTPFVKHLAISGDGESLVTVDMELKQVPTIGRQVMLEGELISETTTLKFWSAKSSTDYSNLLSTSTSVPKELTDLVTNPHGRQASISGVALSHDGNCAATSSKEENSVRIWNRRIENEFSFETTKYSWKCVACLKTPCGLAPPSLLTFSPDDSLVAVAHGSSVLVWDHARSNLLKKIKTGPQNDNILSMEVESGGLLIACSRYQVGCYPIMGASDGKSNVWSYGSSSGGDDPKTNPTMTVSDISYVSETRQVIIAFSRDVGLSNKQTKIVIVDARTGILVETPSCILNGTVYSMCNDGFNVFMLTSSNELRVAWGLIRTQPSRFDSMVLRDEKMKTKVVPTLDLSARNSEPNKKRIHQIEPGRPSQNKKRTIQGLGLGDISSTDLPTLSSNFVRAFVRQRGVADQ